MLIYDLILSPVVAFLNTAGSDLVEWLTFHLRNIGYSLACLQNLSAPYIRRWISYI